MLYFDHWWLAHDPLHTASEYIKFHPLIYLAVVIVTTFCTTYHYHLLTTFDRPYSAWQWVYKVIYRLEKAYLANYDRQPAENLGRVRRWLDSYGDRKTMLRTARQYRTTHSDMGHYFNAHHSLYEAMLRKLNQIEFVLLFLHPGLGNDYSN